MNNITLRARTSRLSATIYVLFYHFILTLFLSALAVTLYSQTECTDSFYVRFPDDRIITACDGTGNYGSPFFYAPDDSFLAAGFRDDTTWVVPDACFKIERTWRVINWCYYDTTCVMLKIPNPSPNADPDHPDNLKGAIVSGICNPSNPWSATHVKITPNDTAATNYCSFWKGTSVCKDGSAKFNGYSYTQIIKIVDNRPPDVVCNTPNGEDKTNNDSLLWNDPVWWDTRHSQHDLAETPVNLSISAVDLCVGPIVTASYLLYLDLDDNGTLETVIDSKQLPPANTVFFDNAQFPNFIGGTARAFDQRKLAEPALDAYRFALKTGRADDRALFSVMFNTQRNPGEYVLPELPHGKHKIKWIIADPCGNETVCEQAFEVKDALPPMIKCKSLSVNIMQTDMVTVWAFDFLESALDNCTPVDQLKYAVSTNEPAPAVFPRDTNGNPITSVNFTCANLGPNVVQLWAEDKAGNADFCQVILLVQDGLERCGVKASVYGTIKTESGKGMVGVYMLLNAPSHPAFPPAYFLISDTSGQFIFTNALPIPATARICPIKDDDHINGVDALDMAIINKHILGIKPLDSQYKMISADVNKSGTITTLDVVGIRSLILGKIKEFPNNLSWRFFDKKSVLPSLRECISVTVPQTESLDFIATKIGDANTSAAPNMNMTPIVRTIYLDTEDKEVQPGAVIEVPFLASEALSAQQFTMAYEGLELLDILPGATSLQSQHFARFDAAKRITNAWAVEERNSERTDFKLRFRVQTAGILSQMLRLTNDTTLTTAYANLDTMSMTTEQVNLALRFKTVSSNEPEKESEQFVLYQNQPNPFSNNTAIKFYLPHSDRAILTITDASGKVLMQQEGQFSKGYQQFLVALEGYSTAGVLFYKVATSEGTLGKKMILYQR